MANTCSESGFLSIIRAVLRVWRWTDAECSLCLLRHTHCGVSVVWCLLRAGGTNQAFEKAAAHQARDTDFGQQPNPSATRHFEASAADFSCQLARVGRPTLAESPALQTLRSPIQRLASPGPKGALRLQGRSRCCCCTHVTRLSYRLRWH